MFMTGYRNKKNLSRYLFKINFRFMLVFIHDFSKCLW